MSLTVETTAELEGSIREDAERHGLDAASYVLRLLQERYAAPPPVAGQRPEGAVRWHSLSGLDANAIEARRGGEASPVRPRRVRVSHEAQRRQRQKTLRTRAAIALLAVALLGGLVYAQLHRPARPPHALHSPRLSPPQGAVPHPK